MRHPAAGKQLPKGRENLLYLHSIVVFLRLFPQLLSVPIDRGGSRTVGICDGMPVHKPWLVWVNRRYALGPTALSTAFEMRRFGPQPANVGVKKTRRGARRKPQPAGVDRKISPTGPSRGGSRTPWRKSRSAPPDKFGGDRDQIINGTIEGSGPLKRFSRSGLRFGAQSHGQKKAV